MDTIDLSKIRFSDLVVKFLAEVDNDISQFDEDQLGMYMNDIKNDYWVKFSAVVSDSLLAVPKDKRHDFMNTLQESSSVFGAKICDGLF